MTSRWSATSCSIGSRRFPPPTEAGAGTRRHASTRSATTCPLPDGQGYENSRYLATLPVSTGWPYRHEAEVYVTSKPNGEVCTIWLTGTDDEMYLRYFYTYQAGELVKVATSGEPDDVSREWRWAGGEPWEYTRRQMPDSVAGTTPSSTGTRPPPSCGPSAWTTRRTSRNSVPWAISRQLHERFPAKHE